MRGIPRTLLAVGVLYFVMMGSTFGSLGVVLPRMIAALHLSYSQAGFGFTLLALAAGLSSVLPAVFIKTWNARVTLAIGVLVLMLAYGLMAGARFAASYYAGALALGVGFSLVGAVPALHILSGWATRCQSLVFGCYLAFGGLGGGCWPSVVEWSIALGGWRFYWWFMLGLIALVGFITVCIVRERPLVPAESATGAAEAGFSLAEALKTSQFYVVACAIAATYCVATTVNAFTVSYLTMIGSGTAMAVAAFSVQSACHAVFPIMMGGAAGRFGVKRLLVIGLIIQAVGMAALAAGGSRLSLLIFAIGVGGGYGTVFLGTTLILREYFGVTHYAKIFGANQLVTTISVAGPVLAGAVADATGRFDNSFAGCAVVLALAAAAAARLRPPVPREAAATIRGAQYLERAATRQEGMP